MKIVIFHRPLRQAYAGSYRGPHPYSPWAWITGPKPMWPVEAFSERKFVVALPENRKLCIDCSFRYFKEKFSGRITVDLKPGTYWSFWYRQGLRRIDVINEDFNRDNAMTASLLHETASLSGAIGRVLVLRDVALLYLRGPMADLPGFENVVLYRNEHATNAFADYCTEAAELMKTIQAKRDEAASYCLHDKVSRLEEQVRRLSAVLGGTENG